MNHVRKRTIPSMDEDDSLAASGPVSSASRRPYAGNADFRFTSKSDLDALLQSKIAPDFNGEILLQSLRDKAEPLRRKLVGQVDEELNEVFEELIQNLAHHEMEKGKRDYVSSGSTTMFHQSTTFSSTPLETSHGRRQHNGQLQRKEFVARASLLTDLFEISHIQTIQYVFVALLILVGLNTVMNDLFDHGTIGVDFHIWTWAFGKFPLVLTFWSAMQGATLFALYIPLNYWTANRSATDRISFFDCLFLGYYLIYLTCFALLPFLFVIYAQLPPASTAIIVAEQIRFMMKGHAFIREKIGEVVEYRKKGQMAPTANFHNYFYFQFAPTLVYRDKYPRTVEIRWHFVLVNFGTVAAGIFYAYYIFVRFCMPVFGNFNHEHVNFKTFMKSIFNCILPGSLNLLVVFYSFLHAWMNAFAEMTRFADRMFYRDWWNSTSFANYYRTWNIVVHDWLYSYVYSDVYRFCGSKYRHIALFVTLLLSAIVHEYILCCLLRIFYPVMFILFGVFGVWAMFFTQARKSRPWNVFLWFGLFLGQGIFLCLYSTEYYARVNCPPTTDKYWLDLVIPRSWNCYVIQPVLGHTLSKLHN